MPDQAFYSPSYVSALVALVTSDDQFLLAYSKIMEGRFFEDAETAWLVDKAKAHYAKYETALTRTIVEQELHAEKANPDMAEAVLLRWDGLDEVDDNTFAYVMETAEEYIRRQAILCAVMESQPLVEEGRQDEVIRLVEAANSVRREREVGIMLPRDQEELLNRLATRNQDVENIPTGIPMLDRFLQGGLRKKEMAVLLGPKGKGKSMWLPWVAGGALMTGESVLCYTLEMSGDDWAARLLSRMSGVRINDLPDAIADGKFEAARRISDTMQILGFEGATAVVKEMAPRKCSPDTVREDIEELAAQGVNCGLLVIDYADLMASRYQEQKRYEEQAHVYADLFSLGKEYGMGVWTASQVNRQALIRRRISLAEIATSFDKVFPADFVLGLAQTEEEEKPDEHGHKAARLLIIAARRQGELIMGNHVPLRLFYERASFREIRDITEMTEDAAEEANVTYEHLPRSGADPDHSDSEGPEDAAE
jgi:hypothetical protein